MTQFAYVGCWTSRWRKARGRGIEVYKISDAGDWSLQQTVESVEENPSSLTLNKPRDLLYAVHGDGTMVATYRRHPVSGQLTLLGEQQTGPQNAHPDLEPKQHNNPVHAACDPYGRYLLVANHGAGNVAIMPIGDGGLPAAPCSFVAIPGLPSDTHNSPGLSRPHEIVFDPSGKHFALPIQGRTAGNGIDMVRIYAFSDGQCFLTDEVLMDEGSWPRHVDFHPDGHFLYVINELINTISVFDYNDELGTIVLKQTQSSLPADYRARSDAGEIEVHPNGRFLYASNRGHDSIGVFGIDALSGELDPIEWVPCGGKSPRFTALSPDGTLFYSAHEESDTVTEFSVNAENGFLERTGREINTASPTCIVFA